MKKLLNWSAVEFSDLPWRTKRTLYRTLVSEIMLQQTTVPTVVSKFEPFLRKYPTLKSLALAQEEDVLRAWEGLGYYRRARNLHRAAKTILEKHKGRVPKDFSSLVEIPGIGDYTANAIIAIGWNEVALAIDANIERVLGRYLGIENKTAMQLKKYLKESFEEGEILKEMGKWGPRAFHEAIMDLGRTSCQAKKIDCNNCLLNKKCLAFRDNIADEIPVVLKKKKDFFETKFLRVLVTKKVKNKTLLMAYQKSKSEWLSGQWELPTLIFETEDPKLTQYPKVKMKKSFLALSHYKTSITKYKILNYLLELDEKSAKKLLPSNDHDRYQFVEYEDESFHLSTASLKALKKRQMTQV